ncbi:hypothetical protein M0804_000588 [Polistes exclamans]|nr:hypothetical protein M0804_000588 [Polistes exclamans]
MIHWCHLLRKEYTGTVGRYLTSIGTYTGAQLPQAEGERDFRSVCGASTVRKRPPPAAADAVLDRFNELRSSRANNS